MGMACTRTLERVAAATGQIEQADVRFDHLCDVRSGGVLLGLPALLANGLLKFSGRFFSLPDGYYSLNNIFLLLGFMALGRVKNVERLRYTDPGEWGKILGLDRIPEVRTLREKIGLLSEEEDAVAEWSGMLADGWMRENPKAAGVLYVDGHVKVYHGSKNKLPKRYVSRQKLALRGVTDYWLNDALGRPFFVVSSAFTTGLLDILENDIVPRLLRDVPNQPNILELDADPTLFRFILIFDREGYSPDFIKRMWDQRIACQTYQKFPKGEWPEEDFDNYKVIMPHGELVEMELAERDLWLGEIIRVREIRRKCDSGHQTSVISTDYRSKLSNIAAHMFARWTQENFFKYMMKHFNIDALTGHKLYGFNETKQVVNPIYRRLEGSIKKNSARLARVKAKFLNKQLPDSDLAPKKMEKYEQEKGKLREDIEYIEKELEMLKADRRKTKKHISFEELPDDERFYRIAPARKQLLDTVKMIAYRAETAMVQILREFLGRKDDARPLLRQIYTADVDLIPNEESNTLTVQLHQLANRQADSAVKQLCKRLNATKTVYPGTNFTLNFELVSK